MRSNVGAVSDPQVRRRLRLWKARGYVTFEELDAVLPRVEVSADAIEATMTMLSGMNIDMVESEDEGCGD